jgi:hypothetical protein
MATSSMSSAGRPLVFAASPICDRIRSRFSAICSTPETSIVARKRQGQPSINYFTRHPPGSWAEQIIMKRLSLLTTCLLVLACSGVFAQGKIDLQPSDTVLSILQKNIGLTVELRMKSGEKIGGKVEKVGDKLVHISQLTGAEFFDAAVDTAEVAAVIVRTKTK